jgi:hypothetical protein
MDTNVIFALGYKEQCSFVVSVGLRAELMVLFVAE